MSENGLYVIPVSTGDRVWWYLEELRDVGKLTDAADRGDGYNSANLIEFLVRGKRYPSKEHALLVAGKIQERINLRGGTLTHGIQVLSEVKL